MKRKTILKDAGVLLIASMMVFTAIVVTANTTTNEVAKKSDSAGIQSLNRCAFSGTADNLNNIAVTKVMDLSGASGNITLKFWQQYAITPPSIGSIMISADGGVTWPTGFSLMISQPSWSELEFDIGSLLVEYPLSNIQIGFKFTTGSNPQIPPSDYWYIDSIIVESDNHCYYTEDFQTYNAGDHWRDWIIVDRDGPPPIFIANFIRPEREPYPFDVKISDGVTLLNFEDAIYIDTAIPNNQVTLTYSYEISNGKTVDRGIQLYFLNGEIKEYEFYAIDWKNAEVRIRPYISAAEKPVDDIKLSWKYDPTTDTLSWNLSRQSDKWTRLSVLFDDTGGKLLAGPTVVVREQIPDPPPPILTRCTFHYNCEDLATWHCSYYTTGHQTNGLIEFQNIPESLGCLRIKYVSCKESLIDEVNKNTILSDINGTLFPQNYLDPQYAVPPGSYLLDIQNISTQYVVPTFPVNVIASINNSYRKTILEINTLKLDDLTSWMFFVAAEFDPIISYAKFSGLTHNENSKLISVNVSSQTEYYDWWGCFVLPDDYGVKSLQGLDSSVFPPMMIDLHRLFDFTINHVGNGTLIVVRIPPDFVALQLDYIQDNAPTAPTISGPVNGKPGVQYSYTVVSTDPENNNITDYVIDWGDNSTQRITGPFASGVTITASHTWAEQGAYTIKAKATDIYSLESDWGTLQVVMPKSISSNQWFLQLLQNHPHRFLILQHLIGL